MSGDYTRLTFRPERQYSSVRLQQGRVQVDADWNEAEEIALHRDRMAALDIIGPTGVPEAAPGFALAPADPDAAGTGTDLLIGFGRAYVEGVLIENPAPAPTVLSAVAGAPGDFLVQSGPVPRPGQWLLDPAGGIAPARIAALAPPAEADAGLRRVTLAPAPAVSPLALLLAPSLLAQPDLTADPVPAAAGTYGLYLEVVEREVTALDDPLLRETALGGPDTCLRTQLAWRLRADASGTLCKDYPPGWVPDPAARARLAARGVPAIAADDPCLIPDPGGYRGIDNRLYRVEVHRGGEMAADEVLVKWSRDNAIHRTRFALAAGRLRVESLGPDEATALAAGQWVELQDEAAWRAGLPGFMVRLGEVNGLEIAVAEIRDPAGNTPLTDADGEPQTAALPGAGLLRRWEGGPPAAVSPGTALALEAGIEVVIGAGTLSAGDFWTVPARALAADVEWPRNPATGAPLAVPAQGIARRFMPLGIVERGGDGRLAVLGDCRPVFPPLTAMLAFQMLGGDGQEAMPDLTPGTAAAPVPLAAPLRVGLARGTTPVPGRLVRFATADADPGLIEPMPGTPAARVLRNTPTEVVIATDAEGVAEVRFSLHARRSAYAVEARLLDASDPARADPMHLPLRFFAAAELAAETGFDPSNCLYQRETPGTEAPAVTVQQALDRLCPAIQFLPLGGDGQVAQPGETLPSPLRVGLLWGGRPLAGARLRFDLLSGDAVLATNDAITGADGTAGVELKAGGDTARDGGVIRVRAAAPGLPQPSWPAELVFTARFATGGAAEPPRLRVLEVLARTATAGLQPLRAGATLPPDTVARGFVIRLDGEVSAAVVKNWFPGEVWVDLPTEVMANAAGIIAGGIACRPDGQLVLGEGTGPVRADVLSWQFTPEAQDWLQRVVPRRLDGGRMLATARLVLHGGAIFSEGEPVRWLDAALRFAEDGTRPVRPGGIGVPGSVMVFPFRIGGEAGRPNGIVLLPLAASPLLASLDRVALARGLDLAVDRERLRAAGVVPAGIPLRGGAADPAEARRLLQPLARATTGRPARVLLREADARLFEAAAQQILQLSGLALQPAPSRAADADGFAAELSAGAAPDLAFGDAEFLDAVGRSTAMRQRLGEPVLIL